MFASVWKMFVQLVVTFGVCGCITMIKCDTVTNWKVTSCTKILHTTLVNENNQTIGLYFDRNTAYVITYMSWKRRKSPRSPDLALFSTQKSLVRPRVHAERLSTWLRPSSSAFLVFHASSSTQWSAATVSWVLVESLRLRHHRSRPRLYTSQTQESYTGWTKTQAHTYHIISKSY